MMKDEMTAILSKIREKYKSFENPEYHFVQAALAERPYQIVMDELSRKYPLVEDTDSNFDVSFGYLIGFGDKRWMLRISMIGPYAFFLRLESDRSILVNPSEIAAGEETTIMQILMRHNIKLLGRLTLDTPIQMKLYNTSIENTTLYQAMFSDTDFLPW